VEGETAGSLHDKLMDSGAKLCLDTANAIASGQAEPKSQKQYKEGELKHAPKIFNAQRQIDWSAEHETIDRLVRGMAPYPAATSTLYIGKEEQGVKIYAVEADEIDSLATGRIETDGKSYFKVGTGGKDLFILEMQLPGKRRMDIRSILNGNVFDKEAFFTD